MKNLKILTNKRKTNFVIKKNSILQFYLIKINMQCCAYLNNFKQYFYNTNLQTLAMKQEEKNVHLLILTSTNTRKMAKPTGDI